MEFNQDTPIEEKDYKTILKHFPHYDMIQAVRLMVDFETSNRSICQHCRELLSYFEMIPRVSVSDHREVENFCPHCDTVSPVLTYPELDEYCKFVFEGKI